MFSPRSADTYTKEWPSGGDQGPVLGLGPFGSVPLQRSVKKSLFAAYLASSFSYLVSSSSYGGRPLGSERPRRPAPAVSLILEPSRVAQAAHNDGDDRRERCACHKRARTFSHLAITVLLLLRARHVHVRRHSMHIFA